jgi:hypothetical protein
MDFIQFHIDVALEILLVWAVDPQQLYGGFFDKLYQLSYAVNTLLMHFIEALPTVAAFAKEGEL